MGGTSQPHCMFVCSMVVIFVALWYSILHNEHGRFKREKPEVINLVESDEDGISDYFDFLPSDETDYYLKSPATEQPQHKGRNNYSALNPTDIVSSVLDEIIRKAVGERAIKLLDKFFCHFCGLYFMDFHSICIHLSAIHKNDTFKCIVCSSTFTEVLFLKRHWSKHKVQERATAIKNCNRFIIFCEKCGKGFTHINKLFTFHRENHNNELFPCSVCGIALYSTYKLFSHYRKKHLIVYSVCIKCTYCPSKFVTPVELNKHICRKHANAQVIYSCYFCDFKYKKPTPLKDHLFFKHYNENIFHCPDSGCQGEEQYKNRRIVQHQPKRANKKKYQRKTHRPADERGFECLVCKRSFTKFKSLLDHNRSESHFRNSRNVAYQGQRQFRANVLTQQDVPMLVQSVFQQVLLANKPQESLPVENIPLNSTTPERSNIGDSNQAVEHSNNVNQNDVSKSDQHASNRKRNRSSEAVSTFESDLLSRAQNLERFSSYTQPNSVGFVNSGQGRSSLNQEINSFDSGQIGSSEVVYMDYERTNSGNVDTIESNFRNAAYQGQSQFGANVLTQQDVPMLVQSVLQQILLANKPQESLPVENIPLNFTTSERTNLGDNNQAVEHSNNLNQNDVSTSDQHASNHKRNRSPEAVHMIESVLLSPVQNLERSSNNTQPNSVGGQGRSSLNQESNSFDSGQMGSSEVGYRDYEPTNSGNMDTIDSNGGVSNTSFGQKKNEPNLPVP